MIASNSCWITKSENRVVSKVKLYSFAEGGVIAKKCRTVCICLYDEVPLVDPEQLMQSNLLDFNLELFRYLFKTFLNKEEN